jgi:hypothetical protein
VLLVFVIFVVVFLLKHARDEVTKLFIDNRVKFGFRKGGGGGG